MKANGKLLLSAEYFVLDGALSLALPTQRGQIMSIINQEEGSGEMTWIGKDFNGTWLDLSFRTNNFDSDIQNGASNRLASIFQAIRKQNTEFLTNSHSINVITTLDYPREWGLGSSSTLIYLLSQWAKVNPYLLLEHTFGGSGYDIACAGSNSPILYRKSSIPNSHSPTIDKIDFNPSFKENIYFVYLNRKQNSREGIHHYKKKAKFNAGLVHEVSGLTQSFVHCEKLADFDKLIIEHEKLIASVVEMIPVKEKLFSDYWGCVKSLGAWGGDFIMVTSDRNEIETRAYFNQKGFNICFKYTELIIQ
jgi:mevalonate kinase